MCKVLILNPMYGQESTINEKDFEKAIAIARRYVARGVFYVKDEAVIIQKEKYEEKCFTLSQNPDSPVFIHCRQPTQGTPKTHLNNHPFTFSGEIYGTKRNIVGCHVGWVSQDEKYTKLQTGDCDSENAIIALAIDPNPLEWCQKHVTGQLFFFNNNIPMMYNAELSAMPQPSRVTWKVPPSLLYECIYDAPTPHAKPLESSTEIWETKTIYGSRDGFIKINDDGTLQLVDNLS